MNTAQGLSLAGLLLLMVCIYYAGMYSGWKKGFTQCRNIDDFFMKGMKKCMDGYVKAAEQEIRELKARLGEPYESGKENPTPTGPEDSGVRQANSKTEAGTEGRLP